MKRPEAAVDRVDQNKLLERFRTSVTELGTQAEVEIPNPREIEPTPKLDKRFANTALRAANELERTDYRRSHMLLIGRMPAFMEATRLFSTGGTDLERQRLSAMSSIQQSKLAIRSLANNIPNMSRGTFRRMTLESAFLFTSDQDILQDTIRESDNHMWSIMHKLGVEGTLASIGLLPDDESEARKNHPGVVVGPGTARIKPLAESTNGDERILDIWSNDSQAISSIRKRGGLSRIPRNEVTFATNWSAADFSPDRPMRVKDTSVIALQERLADALDAKAA